MRQLWASLPYRLLFLAGFLSETGTYISEVAILLRIFELTGHQKAYLGITQAVFLVFMILGTLAGGVWGEGNSKRGLLLCCEFARIPILGAMLFWSDSPWCLILGNGGVAFFSGIFNPTRQALMNEILPPSLIPKANSLFSLSFAFLHAFGPIAGAIAYAALGSLPPILCFDLATYFIGMSLLWRLGKLMPTNDARVGSEPNGSFFQDLRDTLDLLRSEPQFLWVILRCALASTALGVIIPLMPPLTTEVLKLPDTYYGLLLGVFGIGGAAGSFIISNALKRFSIERSLRWLMLGEAISLTALAFVSSVVIVFTLALFYGSLLFARITCQLDFVSLRLPKNFNARANSFLDLSMVIPNVLGAVIVACAGSVPTHVLIQSTAFLFVATALVFLAWEMRQRTPSSEK